MNNEKTVVIKLKGGMGNQMFQYAFGKALVASAKNSGESINLLFDITAYTDPIKKDTRRPYMLELLNTHANLASTEIALKYRNPLGVISKVTRKILHKLEIGNTVTFDPTLLMPPFKNYYEGFWQSEKYFLPIVGKIRQEFTLREPLGAVAEEMRQRIVADPKSVSIFYRRTDYVGDKTFDIGEQDYQKRALARMRELVPDLKLYVMSDDISWVQENADLPQGSVFVSAKEIPAHEEMYLASLCQHQIIPNSTFAWWGAWLNQNPNKIVIAPKDWVSLSSNQAKHYKYITPESWLRI